MNLNQLSNWASDAVISLRSRFERSPIRFGLSIGFLLYAASILGFTIWVEPYHYARDRFIDRELDSLLESLNNSEDAGEVAMMLSERLGMSLEYQNSRPIVYLSPSGLLLICCYDDDRIAGRFELRSEGWVRVDERPRPRRPRLRDPFPFALRLSSRPFV